MIYLNLYNESMNQKKVNHIILLLLVYIIKFKLNKDPYDSSKINTINNT